MTIDEEIQQLGPLKTVAAAIVAYAQAGSSKSQFLSHGKEWLLKPDNWMNLQFVYTRKHSIHISLGVFPMTLDEVENVKISKGRWPSWSKITIDSVLQLPDVMNCLETAYYVSDNDYRKKNGKPKRPEKIRQSSGLAAAFAGMKA